MVDALLPEPIDTDMASCISSLSCSAVFHILSDRAIPPAWLSIKAFNASPLRLVQPAKRGSLRTFLPNIVDRNSSAALLPSAHSSLIPFLIAVSAAACIRLRTSEAFFAILGLSSNENSSPASAGTSLSNSLTAFEYIFDISVAYLSVLAFREAYSFFASKAILSHS